MELIGRRLKGEHAGSTEYFHPISATRMGIGPLTYRLSGIPMSSFVLDWLNHRHGAGPKKIKCHRTIGLATEDMAVILPTRARIDVII